MADLVRASLFHPARPGLVDNLMSRFCEFGNLKFARYV